MTPQQTVHTKVLVESMGVECWNDVDCVRVSRDSILAHNKAVHEEDAYSRFLHRLKDLSDGATRFYYSLKNDEYLWIDQIPSK